MGSQPVIIVPVVPPLPLPAQTIINKNLYWIYEYSYSRAVFDVILKKNLNHKTHLEQPAFRLSALFFFFFSFNFGTYNLHRSNKYTYTHFLSFYSLPLHVHFPDQYEKVTMMQEKSTFQLLCPLRFPYEGIVS
jgi:hypothetical protein